MIKKISIFFLSLFIFLSFGVGVFAWDLQPISNNNVNYGFNVSPSGNNTDYLLDFEFQYVNTGNVLNLTFNNFDLYDNVKNYYDFNIYYGPDHVKTIKQNNITYRFKKSPCILSKISEEWFFGYDLNVIFGYEQSFYNFNGFLSNNITLSLRNTYSSKINHLYFYISQDNVYNIINYYRGLGFVDFDINNYFELFSHSISINNSVESFYFTCCENYIFNYTNPYSSFIANKIEFYSDYLFDVNKIYPINLFQYGYGFFQSCYDLRILNLSGCIFDEDTLACYPTFTQNMLYYVIPPEFPNSKFSDNIDYSSIELTDSFDYKSYTSNSFQNDKLTGLFKNINTSNFDGHLPNNYYSFGFSRLLRYQSMSATYSLSDFSSIKFDVVNASAFYDSGLDSNSTVDNFSSNNELANDLGLYKISCNWYDLKGQLNNLFYYLITGLPFLNDLYLLLNQITVLSKVALSTITFSSYLIGFLGFILCINIVFRKLLK